MSNVWQLRTIVPTDFFEPSLVLCSQSLQITCELAQAGFSMPVLSWSNGAVLNNEVGGVSFLTGSWVYSLFSAPHLMLLYPGLCHSANKACFFATLCCFVLDEYLCEGLHWSCKVGYCSYVRVCMR